MKKIQFQTAFLGAGIMFLGAVPSLGYQGTETEALASEEEQPPSIEDQVLVVQGDSMKASAPHFGPSKVVSRMRVVATGYSSTPDQTDDTPFITASGNSVRTGIVAANFLPIGTKIKLPALYGDRIFVVDDRMHPRMSYRVDIWFPSRQDAIHFGKQATYIEILEG